MEMKVGFMVKGIRNTKTQISGLQRLSGMVFRDIQQTTVCKALWDYPLCHQGQCKSPIETNHALPLLQDPGLEECLRGHSCVEVYRQPARIHIGKTLQDWRYNISTGLAILSRQTPRLPRGLQIPMWGGFSVTLRGGIRSSQLSTQFTKSFSSAVMMGAAAETMKTAQSRQGGP